MTIFGISDGKFHPDPKLKPKLIPTVSKKYREWIKKQECCGPDCPGGCGDIVPAHMRILGRGGMGIKPPDSDLLPLGVFCHALEHSGSVSFWGMGTKAATKKYVQKLCDQHIQDFNHGRNKT